jgi:cobalt-zinc-cadmium efflux system membrane fusion protein
VVGDIEEMHVYLVRHVLTAGAVWASLGLTSCQRQGSQESGVITAQAAQQAFFTVSQDQLAHLQVAPVQRATWPVSIYTTGTVDWDEDNTTQAITQVNGPISRILVDYGTKVHADQPLLWVSSPDVVNALSTYRKARNRVDLAKRISERSKILLDHGAIAQKDYEDTVADYNDAMTDVQNSLQPLKIFGITQKEIDDAEKQGDAVNTELAVRSPIEGTIVQKLVSPGLVIQAGQTACFVISKVGTVWVQGHIFDQDLPNVRLGDAVEMTNTNFHHAFHGTISYIGSFVDPTTRTTDVRIVTQNPQELLKKDMFVDAVIHTGQRNNILALPVSAILRDEKNEPLVYVQVQGQPGKFAQRSVTLGAQQDKMVAIASGLQQGEPVVIEGALFLQFANTSK